MKYVFHAGSPIGHLEVAIYTKIGENKNANLIVNKLEGCAMVYCQLCKKSDGLEVTFEVWFPRESVRTRTAHSGKEMYL